MFYFKVLFLVLFLTKFSKHTLAVTLLFQCTFLPSSRDQAKQTLAVTLLFQCNFLLVVEAENLL